MQMSLRQAPSISARHRSDEDRLAFRKKSLHNEVKDKDDNDPQDPLSPPSPLSHPQCADPVTAPLPINIDLARDLEALTMSMKLYSKEIKMPCVHNNHLED